jgi:uncharacterized protein
MPNIGINVREVDGRAAPTIVGAPISVAGFLVRSVRGVPDTPVHVMGFADYVARFGGYRGDLYGAHAVRGFFDNGGTEAYVVRVVGAGAVVAEATLDDDAGNATLVVTAGGRGYPEPGDWGRTLAVAAVDHPRGSSELPAQVIGTETEPFALTADDEALTVRVDGEALPPIAFTAADFASIGAATAGEVAAVVNRSATAIRAAVTPDNRVLLAATAPGPVSLEIEGAAAEPLGFTDDAANSDAGLPADTTAVAVIAAGGFLPGSAVRLETRGHVAGTAAVSGSVTDGAGFTVTADGGPAVPVVLRASDFAGGAAAITPAEVVRAINRQASGFSATLTRDLRLLLSSNRYGQGSTIALGAPASGDDARAALGLDGAAPRAGRRTFRALSAVSETYKLLVWPDGLPAAAATPTSVARIQSVEFDLVVSQAGVEVERLESLSMQPTLDYYVEAAVNDPSRGSRQVTVADQHSAAGVGANAPAPLATPTPLEGGSDGDPPSDAAYLGDPAKRTGLHAFDAVAIQLLSCPETTSPATVAGAIGYCEVRGDAMFVGTAPRDYDLEGVKTYASAFRARKVFGALYWPWIEVANPLDTGHDPRIPVPPVGHVLGVYARIGDARGVWKAPAGDDAVLRFALGVGLDMTDVDHTDLVKNGGVNGIRAIPGSGIVVDASRTLSTDTRWLFVNVRRLFNFVKTSLRDGLRWVPQEPHDEDLRRRVKFNVVAPFLLGLWRRGAFGSDPPEDVFTIVCDQSNNPPSEVALGNFTIEVFFYPSKPAETIVIQVGQQESGASAGES